MVASSVLEGETHVWYERPFSHMTLKPTQFVFPGPAKCEPGHVVAFTWTNETL